MVLKESAARQLSNLLLALRQVKAEDYSKSLPVLEGSSIGKHVRHILEFYEILLGHTGPHFSYDDRKRNIQLEESLIEAISSVLQVKEGISGLKLDERITLKSKFNTGEAIMETTIARELNYNIEHTVHHLAIIRIAIVDSFPYVKLPASFGYADSTLQNSAIQNRRS